MNPFVIPSDVVTISIAGAPGPRLLATAINHLVNPVGTAHADRKPEIAFLDDTDVVNVRVDKNDVQLVLTINALRRNHGGQWVPGAAPIAHGMRMPEDGPA